MSSLSHGSALVKQPVTFLKNYWRNRITEHLRSAGISGGLQFKLLLRAGSATRSDHIAQDFIQSSAANLQMQRLHEPQTATSTYGLFPLLLFTCMFTVIFLPATHCFEQPGSVFLESSSCSQETLLRPPRAFPSQGQTSAGPSAPTLQGTCPRPHLGGPPLSFHHLIRVFLVPGSKTGYRTPGVL